MDSSQLKSEQQDDLDIKEEKQPYHSVSSVEPLSNSLDVKAARQINVEQATVVSWRSKLGTRGRVGGILNIGVSGSRMDGLLGAELAFRQFFPDVPFINVLAIEFKTSVHLDIEQAMKEDLETCQEIAKVRNLSLDYIVNPTLSIMMDGNQIRTQQFVSVYHVEENATVVIPLYPRFQAFSPLARQIIQHAKDGLSGFQNISPQSFMPQEQDIPLDCYGIANAIMTSLVHPLQ